jgi:hypothetical protein
MVDVVQGGKSMAATTVHAVNPIATMRTTGARERTGVYTS